MNTPKPPAPLLAGLLALLFVQPLAADEPGPEPWEFVVTPYVWAISLDGDAIVRGFEAPVDVDFSDVWDKLNFAAMVQGEVRRGCLGGFVDFVYGDVESEDTP